MTDTPDDNDTHHDDTHSDDERESLESHSRPEHAQDPAGEDTGADDSAAAAPSVEDGEHVTVDRSELPDHILEQARVDGGDDGPSEAFNATLSEENQARLNSDAPDDTAEQPSDAVNNDPGAVGDDFGATDHTDEAATSADTQANDGASDARATTDTKASEVAPPPNTSGSTKEYLDQLREQYARGDITEAEFEAGVDAAGEGVAPDYGPEPTASESQTDAVGRPATAGDSHDRDARGESDRATPEQTSTELPDDGDGYDFDFENQDFSSLKESAPKIVVTIRDDNRFLLADPAEHPNTDADLDEVQREGQELMDKLLDDSGQIDFEAAGDDAADEWMYRTVSNVVLKPATIPRDEWADWQLSSKMALVQAVMTYTNKYVSGFTTERLSSQTRGGRR